MNRVIFASTRDADMHYAVKTPITSSFFYIEVKGKKYALLDRVDFGVIPKKAGVKTVLLNKLSAEAKKIKFQTSDRNKIAYHIFQKYGLLKKPVQVPIHFPLDMADFLRKNGAKLVPTYPFFPERTVKNEQEIRIIKNNIRHTCKAFRIIEKILRQSKIVGNKILYKNKVLTCEFLKQEAEKALIEKGMFDILGMIISTGLQTATPHHSGAGPVLPHQPIICDIFPRHRESGYFADMTRTYVKGKPTVEIQKMYDAVLEAQLAAIKKISASSADGRARVSAQEVYDAAAKVIIEKGYDVGEAGFIHGLGHGVGLDIHEKPSLKARSKDMLEAGNIITIEPGLYYPEIGGIRIEDMLLVTKTGCKNLTNYPKKLVIP